MARRSSSPRTASRRRSTRTRAARKLDDDRRDVPARLEGARRGASLRGAGLHGLPRRPRGPRGGRRDDGRGADSILLVETAADAELVRPPQTERLAYITQTTLSVDDTSEIVDVLRRRFPEIEAPEKDDICYATTNRQRAVKRLLGGIDLLLVVGSRNSSNSNRLVEVARARGVDGTSDRRRERDRGGVARRGSRPSG